MTRLLTACLACAFLLAATGCATTGGATKDEKRKSVLQMRDSVLAELYRERPQAKGEIANAPGYAVFSNANVNLIFASFGGGYGVVNDKSGRVTYMKMGEVGIGLGAGVKDFRRGGEGGRTCLGFSGVLAEREGFEPSIRV